MPKNYPNLDIDLPINIKHLQLLTDQVASRYPHIPKYKVILIIRAFFKSIRSLLLSEQVISLSGLFTQLHLIQFKRGNYNVIKPKLNTPRRFKRARIE